MMSSQLQPHYVLCNGKVAFEDGWQYRRPTREQVKAHTARGGLYGIVPASVNALVVDRDEGDIAALGKLTGELQRRGIPFVAAHSSDPDNALKRHLIVPFATGAEYAYGEGVGNRNWTWQGNGGQIRHCKGYVIVWDKPSWAAFRQLNAKPITEADLDWLLVKPKAAPKVGKERKRNAVVMPSQPPAALQAQAQARKAYAERALASGRLEYDLRKTDWQREPTATANRLAWKLFHSGIDTRRAVQYALAKLARMNQRVDLRLAAMALDYWRVGGRNQFLNDRVFAAMQDGYPEAVEGIAREAVQAGLPQAEVDSTVASAMRAGDTKPRVAYVSEPAQREPVGLVDVDAAEAETRALVADRVKNLLGIDIRAPEPLETPIQADTRPHTPTQPPTAAAGHTEPQTATEPLDAPAPKLTDLVLILDAHGGYKPLSVAMREGLPYDPAQIYTPPAYTPQGGLTPERKSAERVAR